MSKIRFAYSTELPVLVGSPASFTIYILFTFSAKLVLSDLCYNISKSITNPMVGM